MSAGYQVPKNPPQGRWARHIHAVRQKRDWSRTKGFEEVREALGLRPKSISAYYPLDMGKREPDEREAKALASVYGWPPEGDAPSEPVSTTLGSGDLYALVEAQTRAMEAQAAAFVQLAQLISARSEVSSGEHEGLDDALRHLREELAEVKLALRTNTGGESGRPPTHGVSA